MIRGSTVALPNSDPSLYSAGGQTLSISDGAIIVGGTTLTPGALAIKIGVTAFRLVPSSSVPMVNRQTHALPGPVPSGPVITATGETFLAAPTALIVSGSTLLPGQIITVDGTVINLASDGRAVVVGGSIGDLSAATRSEMTGLVSMKSVGEERGPTGGPPSGERSPAVFTGLAAREVPEWMALWCLLC